MRGHLGRCCELSGRGQMDTSLLHDSARGCRKASKREQNFVKFVMWQWKQNDKMFLTSSCVEYFGTWSSLTCSRGELVCFNALYAWACLPIDVKASPVPKPCRAWRLAASGRLQVHPAVTRTRSNRFAWIREAPL